MTRHDHQCPRRKGSPEEVAFNALLPEPVLKHKASSLEESSLPDGGFQDRYRAFCQTWTEISPRRVGKPTRPHRRGRMHLSSRLALATSQKHVTKPELRSFVFVGTNGRFCGIRHSFCDEFSLSVPMLLKLLFLKQFLRSLCLFCPAPRASRWLPTGGGSLHHSDEIVFVHFATIPPIELWRHDVQRYFSA